MKNRFSLILCTN